MLYTENIGLRDCSGFLQIGSHILCNLGISIWIFVIQPHSLELTDNHSSAPHTYLHVNTPCLNVGCMHNLVF